MNEFYNGTVMNGTVMVYDSPGNKNFGDGLYLVTPRQLQRDLMGCFSEGDPTFDECKSALIDIDNWLDGRSKEEIKSLIENTDRYGWGTSPDWRKARKFLEARI